MDEQNPINATQQEWQVVYVPYMPEQSPVTLTPAAIFLTTLETVLEDELQQLQEVN